MPYLPINLDIQNKNVLVVGGGAVAFRKTSILLESGANVHIVTPDVINEIGLLNKSGKITLRTGTYELNDLKDKFLVIAATDDPEINKQIAIDAKKSGILVLVADAPEHGNCIFPAVLRRKNLEITVSSGGKCPAFALELKKLIASIIGDDYGMALEDVSAKREKLLTEGNENTYNSSLLRKLSEEMINDIYNQKNCNT